MLDEKGLDDEEQQPHYGQPSVKGGEGEKGGGGGGRDFLPVVQTMPHRWVDLCSSSSSSRCSSATSSSTEDMRLLLPGRRETRAHVSQSEFLPDGAQRCAPGFERGDDGGAFCDGRGGTIANIDRQRPRDFFRKNWSEEQHHERRSSREVAARRARRLPLSVYTDATAVSTSSQEQQDEQHTNYHTTLGIATNSRLFAWFVLLHGCLCEAPLAVLEGLVRGPLYLVAAAWIAIVSLIGASSHAEQRAELSQHAAALAREGILLLVATLTLAVPFSTSFTVYGEVIYRTDDWDVRTVPTLLGAVDPLRFFVFAFGQAGELASNGRPEPLRQLDSSQLSRWAIAPSSPPSSLAAGGGRRERPDACIDGSPRFLPPVSYVGVIAAQSMDADRLGVGILHPPQEIGLRFRRGGATVRRMAVSAYRRLATRVATGYRRLPTSGIVMARIRGRSTSSVSETRHSAAARSGQEACVV